MAGEALLMRDLDPADHDMVTGREAVYVETLSDPDVAEPRCKEPLGGGEVVRCRHFQIVLAAGHDDRSDAGGFGDRGIVGQHSSDGGTMRRQDWPKMEALRRL